MDKIVPPFDFDSHRWHWIDTEHGVMAASWFPGLGGCGSWDISGHIFYADDARVRTWRYIAPAIPPEQP